MKLSSHCENFGFRSTVTRADAKARMTSSNGRLHVRLDLKG